MNGSARAMSDTCRKIQPLRFEGFQYCIFPQVQHQHAGTTGVEQLETKLLFIIHAAACRHGLIPTVM